MRKTNPFLWIIASYVCTASGAVIAVGSMAGCDSGEPILDKHVVGVSAEDVGYCITNVRAEPNTIHFVGQQWLIGSAEGLGPQDLSLKILKAVAPEYSTTTAFTIDSADISEAVGYSVTSTYSISAGYLATVPEDTYERLEAYTAYQRAHWEIHDADCGVQIGFGAAYKPIGVHFQTVEAESIALPDPGVHVVDCVVPGRPPPPMAVVDGEEEADAGAPEADGGG